MTARIGLRRCTDRPILPSEFFPQLREIWRPPAASGKAPRHVRIGLCVSGGPDSMALASLFQQLKAHDLIPGVDIKALVIDHAHRAGSGKEAKWVSKLLQDIGVQPRVIALKWPEGRDHASRTDFETAARRLRYQCFARTCVEENIRHLFLGHHQSDQVETILLRLIRGQSPSLAGLYGMRSVNGIPHSTDIFGASDGLEGAPLLSLWDPALRTASTIQAQTKTSNPVSGDIDMPFPQILISQSGIKIYRPMLSYPKSRLIATCETNRLPFVTDQSNFDPSVTKRNTIRWLIKNDKLPDALREQPILHLRAAAAKSQERRKNEVVRLLRATRVTSFDLRSGRLLIAPPPELLRVHDLREMDAASYVDHLLRLVSPASEKSTSSQKLVSIAKWMLPELRVLNPCDVNTKIIDQAVTARGVRIARQSGKTNGIWELSRQPFRATENPQSTFAAAATAAVSACSDDPNSGWSRWVKWDGRYWIRIRTIDLKDVSNFHIRPLKVTDLRSSPNWKEEVIRPRYSKLKNLLREAAPGKISSTLPVLLKHDQVRALPTCGIGWRDNYSETRNDGGEDLSDGLEWEVRYKDVSDILQYLQRPQIT